MKYFSNISNIFFLYDNFQFITEVFEKFFRNMRCLLYNFVNFLCKYFCIDLRVSLG